MLETLIVDTQSGALLETIRDADGAWQRGAVTQKSHVIDLDDVGLSRAQARDLFGADRPRDRVLTQTWGGVPIYHGLIIDSTYAPATHKLTVFHDDVRELASGRWLYGIGGYAPDLRFLWQGLSLRGLAARVASVIYTAPISGAWPIPMTIPAEEGGTSELDVWAWQFRSGEDLLQELESMPNGPDIDFHPRVTGDVFGWDMRIGNPYLSGPTLEYHLQAERTPLTDVVVRTVGQEKITGVFGVGEGSERDMIVGGAAASVSAGLARDTILTDKSAHLATINSLAQAHLDSRVGAAEYWTFNARTNATDETGIDLAALRIGSTIRVESVGDPWVDDGWTSHRVLGFSGKTSDIDVVELVTEKI